MSAEIGPDSRLIAGYEIPFSSPLMSSLLTTETAVAESRFPRKDQPDSCKIESGQSPACARTDGGPQMRSKARLFRVQDPETYAYLERAVRKACPHWLKHQEDDIVQKAALKVFRLLNAQDSPEQVAGTYLYRVASTVVIDAIRSASRALVQTDPLDEEKSFERPSFDRGGKDPESSARQRQIGQAILDCMSRLLRDRRMALSLKLQGYSNRESAKMLGWALKRTENLATRGQADLRTCLSKKEIVACG